MATVKNLLSAMIDKINATPKTVNGIAPDVNGNIEVAGGGASSWNDLKDKPFESVTELVDVLSLQSITNDLYYEEGEEILYYYYAFYDLEEGDKQLEESKKYHVHINGQEYIYKADKEYFYGSDDTYDEVLIGNKYFAAQHKKYVNEDTFEDTGELFYITRGYSALEVVWHPSLGETITVEITEEKENIKQLDSKFVEGTDFVVNIEYYYDESEEEARRIYTADKTYKEIQAAVNAGRNVIARVFNTPEYQEENYSGEIIPLIACRGSAIFAGFEDENNILYLQIEWDNFIHGYHNQYIPIGDNFKPAVENIVQEMGINSGSAGSGITPTIFTYNSYWDYETNEDGEFKKELSCNKTFNQVVEDFKNGNPLTYVHILHDEDYYFDDNSYITPNDVVLEIYEGEDGEISEEGIIRVWLHGRPMPSISIYGHIEYFADGHFNFYMGTGE